MNRLPRCMSTCRNRNTCIHTHILTPTQGLFALVLFLGPVMVAVFCFGSYTLAGNVLTAADGWVWKAADLNSSGLRAGCCTICGHTLLNSVAGLTCGLTSPASYVHPFGLCAFIPAGCSCH